LPLRRRLLLINIALAIAAAVIIDVAVARVRAADRTVALERTAAAFLSDFARDSCETDSSWFLAGPRGGRPTQAQRQMIDAEVYLPRPKTDPLPFEFFPYDEQFLGSSTASPRFPDDLKQVLKTTPSLKIADSPFVTTEGTGHQVAELTGWTPGPCAVLLFRTRPEPGSGLRRAAIFSGSALLIFAVATIAIAPTAARIRKLSAAARASAREEYTTMTPVSGNDEIASLAAVFNEASADIRRKMVDAADREEALQRHVSVSSEDVAGPLAELSADLGRLEESTSLRADDRDAVRQAIRSARQLTVRLENLAAVARLRTGADRLSRPKIDVTAVVRDVVAGRRDLARASDVTLHVAAPPNPIEFEADPGLLAQAIGNVVDNAIFYNRPGGRVDIELKSYERDHKFSLRVVDDGPGVDDEQYGGLTANKRFRGDESRTRRPGGRGLGLALAREIADRLGLLLEIRRPSSGGLEVEFLVRK
jgi:signal transduction histidine kinase